MNQQKKEMPSTIEVLRSARIHDIALFDLGGAIIGTEIVFRWFGAPKYWGAFAAIPIGAVVHRVIGIKTKI